LNILQERREYLKIKALDSKIKDQRICDCILYLEKNFARKISIRQLAGKVFLSSSRFQHLFKRETGLSLLDYLTHLRLENAAGMLRTTELSLGVIAERCGISDQSRLGKLFKKQYKITPLHYRKQFKNI
jgi:transcriptional regulator GlxA family with amidase domain